MTATDELRRLLDGRGVEYKDRNVFGKHVFHWGKPFHGAMFTDGGEWTELVVENATPEQAVEATLVSDLEAENAKLRRLVLDYEELAAALCDARECDGCPFDSEQTICEHMRLIARVGELGVDA